MVGTPAAAFSYADETATVSLMEFIGMRDAANAKDAAIPTADQAFQKAEGDLHVTQTDLNEFVAEALKVGRSQFAEGTAEREVIDAVPTTLPTQPPGQAVISVLTSPEPNVIHVEYDAPSGTSFDLFWRVQGTMDWLPQAEDVIQRERDLPGAVSGTVYEVMVRARNSRGTGPDSAPGVVTAS
jgi:hypothetical protein